MISSCYTRTVTLLADGALCTWDEYQNDEYVEHIEPTRHDIGPCKGFTTIQMPPAIVVVTEDERVLMCPPAVPTNFKDITGEPDSKSSEPVTQSKGSVSVENGCAYIWEKIDGTIASTRIEFERDEYIVNAITSHILPNIVFFTTQSGACYFMDAGACTNEPKPSFGKSMAILFRKFQGDDTSQPLAIETTDPQEDTRCLKHKPVLLEFLSCYSVENVFILRCGSIVIQHGEGKLCLLISKNENSLLDQLIYGTGWSIDEAYINGTAKPIELPYFDDRDIVYVAKPLDCIYFVTATGQMYVSREGSVTESSIERITFFDDNPIRVPHSVPRTKSATSEV